MQYAPWSDIMSCSKHILLQTSPLSPLCDHALLRCFAAVCAQPAHWTSVACTAASIKCTVTCTAASIVCTSSHTYSCKYRMYSCTVASIVYRHMYSCKYRVYAHMYVCVCACVHACVCVRSCAHVDFYLMCVFSAYCQAIIVVTEHTTFN
jgi:hypothetical protein